MNPRYRHLIEAFGHISGTPVPINTSFNAKRCSGSPATTTEFLRDLGQFMLVRKKFWLLPLILILVLLGGLVVISQQSALASLIDTIF